MQFKISHLSIAVTLAASMIGLFRIQRAGGRTAVVVIATLKMLAEIIIPTTVNPDRRRHSSGFSKRRILRFDPPVKSIASA